MTSGPEYYAGYRERLTIDGVAVLVEARHYCRKRLPRGHEIARQMMQRGNVEMMDDVTYEWRMIFGRQNLVVRRVPAGFQVGNNHRVVFRTMREAVETTIKAEAAG